MAPPRPVPAVVELIEHHRGPKYGQHGVVAPNRLRINGVPVWAPVDDPVVLHELHVDGNGGPFIATISLQVRHLVIGADAVASAPVTPPAGDRPVFSVVQMRTGAGTPLVQGEPVPLLDEEPVPSVRVNGHDLLLAEPGIVVDRLVAGDDVADRICRVRLPLVCRRFIVDDEVDGAGLPPGVFPAAR